MKLKKAIAHGFEALSKAPVIGDIFKTKPKVAVIRLSGVIADGARGKTISYERFAPLIEEAFEVHKLQAVALVINSPGGSAAQSALIGNLIRALAEKNDVPVLAFIEDVAASGGYWLACAADEIYGQEVSIAGSIGVISASFGFKDLIEKHGVERRIHTAGKNKSFMDPFADEKPDDVKRLKTLQADLHESFKDWVRQRRGEKLTGADKDLFEGQFWTARTAKELGIIDEIGDVKTTCEEKFGEEIKFVAFKPGQSWITSLLGDAKFSIAEDIAATIEHKAMWGRYGL